MNTETKCEIHTCVFTFLFISRTTYSFSQQQNMSANNPVEANLFTDCQHGFRKNISCMARLLYVNVMEALKSPTLKHRRIRGAMSMSMIQSFKAINKVDDMKLGAGCTGKCGRCAVICEQWIW